MVETEPTTPPVVITDTEEMPQVTDFATGSSEPSSDESTPED